MIFQRYLQSLLDATDIEEPIVQDVSLQESPKNDWPLFVWPNRHTYEPITSGSWLMVHRDVAGSKLSHIAGPTCWCSAIAMDSEIAGEFTQEALRAITSCSVH